MELENARDDGETALEASFFYVDDARQPPADLPNCRSSFGIEVYEKCGNDFNGFWQV